MPRIALEPRLEQHEPEPLPPPTDDHIYVSIRQQIERQMQQLDAHRQKLRELLSLVTPEQRDTIDQQEPESSESLVVQSSRTHWTAEQRDRISRRMKQYWGVGGSGRPASASGAAVDVIG